MPWHYPPRILHVGHSFQFGFEKIADGTGYGGNGRDRHEQEEEIDLGIDKEVNDQPDHHHAQDHAPDGPLPGLLGRDLR